jgi:hypothetical protein
MTAPHRSRTSGIERVADGWPPEVETHAHMKTELAHYKHKHMKIVRITKMEEQENLSNIL